MITYEMLSANQQAEYDKTNKIRKITMFFALILSIVLFLFTFFSSVSDSGFKGAVVTGFFVMHLVCGLIHGLMHFALIFKWVFKKIPFPISLAGALVVYMIGGVIGIYLLIIDFILFIKKKPLVYPFEVQLFTKLYN